MYPLKKLSEICEIVNGGTPDTWNQSYWDGDILWITPKDMWKLKDIYVSETFRKITKEWLANSSAKLFPPNSIILSSRAPIWHLAINTEPMCTNQGCKWLIPRKNLDAKYLYYFLLNSVDLLNNLWTGTTFKELSSSKLKEVEVPLPPLSTQLDIVARLDSAMAEIETLRRETESALASTRELWESTLESVFTSGGKDWEEKDLGNIVKITSSKRIYKNEYTQSGIPFYRSKEIVELENNEDISLVLFISNERYNEIKTKFWIPKKWDILLTAIWTIGNTYIVQQNDIFYFKDGNILWLKCNEATNSEYIRYAIKSFIKKIRKLSIWSTYNALPIEKLSKYKIPFPPLPEQSRIVTHLDAVRAEMEQLEWFYSEKLASLDELKRSVFQEAFS